MMVMIQILGKGMSEKMWKATTKHARTCKVEEKQCLYQGQLQMNDQLNKANGVAYNGCFATQSDLLFVIIILF